MNSAIITFAVGCKFEDIRYFIQSSQVNAPYAYLYIFVGDNIEELRYQCDIFPGVYLLPYKESRVISNLTKLMERLGFTSRNWAGILQNRFISKCIPTSLRDAITRCLAPVTVNRFFHLRKLIKSLPYDEIMISVSHDVLFLSNPFTNLTGNEIVSGAESTTIQQDEKSTQSLKEIYSTDIYEQLKDKPVMSAGVTIGSKRAIVQFLNEVVDEVSHCMPAILNGSICDRAIHMKVFYTGLKGLDKGLEINGNGKIATLNFSGVQDFDYKNGSIQNKNGKELAVVHYFDRNAELVSYLKGFILSKQIIFTNAWELKWQR